MKNTSEILNYLSQTRQIVLLPHTRPDGDAIGSCLAFQKYLIKKGHTATVISPDDFPSFLQWMPGSENIYIYQKKPKTCFAILSKADLIICCDFNALKRVDIMSEDLEKLYRPKFMMIDHHREPDDFADFNFWDDKACSTCELVYEFIRLVGDEEIIDEEIASKIYTGIAMDTGVFQYSNTTAKAHTIASKLIEKNIDIETIHNNLFNQFKENRLRFIGYLLLEKLEIIENSSAAYLSITMKEADKYKLGIGDKEGIVNLPLAVEKIKLSALFTEDKDKIKISFRSKGDINVNEFARIYFNGGGHNNASGGVTNTSLEETIEFFKLKVAEFMSNNSNE